MTAYNISFSFKNKGEDRQESPVSVGRKINTLCGNSDHSSAPWTVPTAWPGGERDWRDWGGEGLGGGSRASWGQGPSGTLHTVLTAPRLFVASDEGQVSSL